MEIVKKSAFARAGLLGNPSDGYNGKTISFCIHNYCAQAVLYEWEDLEIVPCEEDQGKFESIFHLADDVRLHGYYGGVRLVKATIKKFVEFCRRTDRTLHNRNFSIRYQTNIPRQVGMAGSSAIIVASLRCLMDFYKVSIPLYLQPSLVLSVEREELGIMAGLQDRVIQVYDGMVYMDFDKAKMQTESELQYGAYEPLEFDPSIPLYIAFKTEESEPTEVLHNNLRARYDLGDPAVVEGMKQFARFAEQGKEALVCCDYERLNQLINANFDLRRKLCRLPEGQVEMIEVARSCGASAKFAGSGGAIVGLCAEEDWQRLKRDLGAIGCTVIRCK